MRCRSFERSPTGWAMSRTGWPRAFAVSGPGTIGSSATPWRPRRTRWGWSLARSSRARGAGRGGAAADHLAPALIVDATDIGPEGGYRAARQLLELPERPTAVFCFRDLMAMGVYHAAIEAGLRLPPDRSVVGFDDLEFVASGLLPGLTTVALPHYEMGAWGVQRLLALMESPSERTEQVKLCGQLIRRSSVAPPPARPSGGARP